MPRPTLEGTQPAAVNGAGNLDELDFPATITANHTTITLKVGGYDPTTMLSLTASITSGGSGSLTREVEVEYSAFGGFLYSTIFTMHDTDVNWPSTGDIVITVYTGGGNFGQIRGKVSLWKDTDTAGTPVRATGTSTGTSAPSATLNSNSDTDILLACAAIYNGSPTTETGEIAFVDNGSSSSSLYVWQEDADGSTTTIELAGYSAEHAMSAITLVGTSDSGAVVSRTLSDSIDVNDPADPKRRLRDRESLDSISLADLAAMLRSRRRSSLDSASLSDFMAMLRLRDRVLSDSLSVSDSMSVLNQMLTVLSDALDVDDNIVQLRNRYREIADSLTVLSNEEMQRQRQRMLLEAITLTDTAIATYVSIGISSVVLTDSIDVTDFPVGARDRIMPILESFAVADSVTSIKSRAVALLESLSVSDNATSLRNRMLLILDSISVTDNIIVTAAGIKTVSVTDSIDVTDQASQRRIRDRALNDYVTNVVDALVGARDRNRSFFDALIVADSATASYITSGVNSVILNDAIEVFDSLLTLRASYRALSDDISIIDSIIASYIIETLNALIVFGLEREPIQIDIVKEPIITDIDLEAG